MSSSGIGVARAPEDPSRVRTQQPAVPETPVPEQVRQAAHWFFWIVAVTAMDSVLVLLGGHIHRFTGLGVTAVVNSFTGANPIGHVVANDHSIVTTLT